MDSIDVRRINPHKCRHVFNTLLVTYKADKAARLKLVGHSQRGEEFNLKTYDGSDVDFLYNELMKVPEIM